jgi:hypothetical protein
MSHGVSVIFRANGPFKCDAIADDGDALLAAILPTPLALRDISNKAQQSLASLYQVPIRCISVSAEKFTDKNLPYN